MMEKDRNKEIPEAYIVLLKDNKVLLSRRFNTGYMDGYYGLPAGHIEKNETFLQGCIRETKEEVGVDIKPGDLEFVHLMHRNSRKEYPQGVAEGVNERVGAFFYAKGWSGEPINAEQDKCDDLSWFNLDNLPENTIPFVRYALECISEKVFYSEFGWEDN